MSIFVCIPVHNTVFDDWSNKFDGEVKVFDQFDRSERKGAADGALRTPAYFTVEIEGDFWTPECEGTNVSIAWCKDKFDQTR